MRTFIFANGELKDEAGCKSLISDEDLIIAANGGSLHCKKLSITPNIIVGDLDSIPETLLKQWSEKDIEIFQHNTDKDLTDLELALNHAKKANSKEVVILGGLGKRWDHSLANIMLTANEQYLDLNISFYFDDDWFYVVSSKKEIEGNTGQTISILPLAGDAKGVSTTGLKWSLDKENLPFGASRGMSNILSKQKAIISVDDGVLLVIKNKEVL